MPQYIQREYSSTEERDMATVRFFVGLVSLILTGALSLVLYHWCKRIEKKHRDRERKELQEGKIELPKMNFKQKLEFVF
jgi:hypothetical protein